MPPRLLETPRLILEPTTRAHAAETWPGLDDERMWTYFPHLRPHSLDHLSTIYERRAVGSPDESQRWLNFVCRDRESGAAVGEVQATIALADCTSYVAYDIFASEQGKGYGREAVRGLIEHLKETYRIERFFAEIHPENAPSIALIEALGFKRVQTREDELLYELTR